MTPNRRHLVLCLLAAAAAGAMPTGCVRDPDPNMRARGRYKPFEASQFFADGSSARRLVTGTVPREPTPTDTEDNPAAARPPVTPELLARGRERFEIHCSVCHGRDGYADGMVVQRGYPAPPSFHIDRLRTVADDHLFRVITEGLGKMQPYAPRVPVADRWAIIAYIRALQLSQAATAQDLPPETLDALQGRQPGAEGASGATTPEGQPQP